MWDYEHAYPGGPMVDAPPLPRPMHPPDAEPAYPASVDGPDVLAYKRVICRAGRWGPWDPSSWDDSFSTAFARGKPNTGGDVLWTGVAGVQRQQHLDATGYIGANTYNTLRSIRIPAGLGHAGEMAMDSYAASLLYEAYDLFAGHEPSHGGAVRNAALARARSQVGVQESPAGSNMNKYGAWYGDNGVPWCAIFCTWSFELGAQDVGKDSPSFVKGSRWAYVPYMISDAVQGRNGLSITFDPQPGSLVAYDWDFDGVYDHVGVFSRWLSGTEWEAVEGNTSTSNNSNGGQVMLRTRTSGAQAVTFINVAEPS